MTPDAAKLIIADHLVASDPEGIRDLPLLLYRKEDVALHAQNQYGGVGQRSQACCQVWQMRGRVHRGRMALRMRQQMMVLVVCW